MHDCLSEQKSDETFHSTDEMHHENNVLSRILLQRVKSLVTCFGKKSPRHKKTLKKKHLRKITICAFLTVRYCTYIYTVHHHKFQKVMMNDSNTYYTLHRRLNMNIKDILTFRIVMVLP